MKAIVMLQDEIIQYSHYLSSLTEEKKTFLPLISNVNQITTFSTKLNNTKLNNTNKNLTPLHIHQNKKTGDFAKYKVK